VSQPDRLFWHLLGRAARRPLNLLVLAGMLVAALLVTPWLAAAAVPVYGLLVAASLRGPARALEQPQPTPRELAPAPDPRDLDGLPPGLRARVAAALRQEREILRDAEVAAVAPEGLADEVRALAVEIVAAARRAAEIDRYLATVDRDAQARRLEQHRAAAAEGSQGAAQAADALAEQLRVVDQLRERRRALDEELDHVEAGLGTIHARLVQASSSAAGRDRISGDVDALRERMRVLAHSLAEAYGDNAPGTPPGG
jgi:hypothetical protein